MRVAAVTRPDSRTSRRTIRHGDARRQEYSHQGQRKPSPVREVYSYHLGWVYANLGRLAEADALLERAILQQPNEPSGHGNLGWVRLRAGDNVGARHALEMALTLQPDSPWVVNMMGVACARLGDWPLAVGYFERAVELVPDSPLARDNLARALVREQPGLAAEGP